MERLFAAIHYMSRLLTVPDLHGPCICKSPYGYIHHDYDKPLPTGNIPGNDLEDAQNTLRVILAEACAVQSNHVEIELPQ